MTIRCVLPVRAARARRWAIPLASALLAAACSVMAPAPADAPVLHVLDATPVAAAAPAARPLVLEVATPRAAPGFDTAAMAYVRKAHVVDYYAVHRWVEPPAQMLAPLLVRALEDTRAFRAVVRDTTGVRADVRLDTELLRLQQSFAGRPSRAEVALRAQLVDVGSRRVVATRTIEVARDAPSDDPDGGAAAANAAVAHALGEVAAFAVTASADVAPRAAP
ncbi:MAG: ABC-type transport auxiliary lipoprotein family protein [Burkholderiales bacterium]